MSTHKKKPRSKDLRYKENTPASISQGSGTGAGGRGNRAVTRDPLGQGLKEVLEREEVALLKDFFLARGKKNGMPQANVLSRYTPNAGAVIGNLVGIASGALIQEVQEADLTPNQRMQHLTTAAKVTMDAIKTCYAYTTGKPKEIKDSGEAQRPPEVIILNPNVPDVPLPLPENEK